MEGELKNLIQVWFFAVSSLCYCYLIPNRISNGITRLLSLLPIIFLFIILPLSLTTVLLAGPTIFYLVWLANFKLLLFAFNRGPLDSKPPLPFLTFISIALLPINPKHVSDPDPLHMPVLLTFKALILAVIVGAYRYEDNLHPNVILGFYCFHVYLGVKLIRAMTSLLQRDGKKAIGMFLSTVDGGGVFP